MEDDNARRSRPSSAVDRSSLPQTLLGSSPPPPVAPPQATEVAAKLAKIGKMLHAQSEQSYAVAHLSRAPPLTPAEFDRRLETKSFTSRNADLEQVRALYARPLLELVFDAAKTHRMHHDPRQVQQCTLLSIKTGGCPETCNYCAQSSSWKGETKLKAEKLMGVEEVIEAAKRAKEAGSTRFCMGTAWRGPSQVGAGQFERVLEMTKEVRDMGMEVCATLGMLTPEQALKLKDAGLTAYNHNLDTSPEYYDKVTSSRKYEDRLNTIAAVREAGISVCCGGILGLGEEESDRASLMTVLATLPEHPESVPINALVPVEGTPFKDMTPPSGLEMVRAIAVARILMPATVVRLSAGRVNMSPETQALCFMAGANSVFTGDKLLTTPNNEKSEDSFLFEELGLEGRPAFVPYAAGAASSDGSEWKHMKHEL